MKTKNEKNKGGRPPSENPKGAHLHIRLESSRKAGYVRAAGGKKLSVWVLRHLDRAAGRDGGEGAEK